MPLADSEIEAGIAKDLLPLLDVWLLPCEQRTRDCQLEFLCAEDNAGGENSQRRMPAENIDEDKLSRRCSAHLKMRKCGF